MKEIIKDRLSDFISEIIRFKSTMTLLAEFQLRQKEDLVIDFWNYIDNQDTYHTYKEFADFSFTAINNNSSETLLASVDRAISRIFFPSIQSKEESCDKELVQKCPEHFFIHNLLSHSIIDDLITLLRDNGFKFLQKISTPFFIRLLRQRLEDMTPQQIEAWIAPDEKNRTPLSVVSQLRNRELFSVICSDRFLKGQEPLVTFIKILNTKDRDSLQSFLKNLTVGERQQWILLSIRNLSKDQLSFFFEVMNHIASDCLPQPDEEKVFLLKNLLNLPRMLLLDKNSLSTVKLLINSLDEKNSSDLFKPDERGSTILDKFFDQPEMILFLFQKANSEERSLFFKQNQINKNIFLNILAQWSDKTWIDELFTTINPQERQCLFEGEPSFCDSVITHGSDEIFLLFMNHLNKEELSLIIKNLEGNEIDFQLINRLSPEKRELAFSIALEECLPKTLDFLISQMKIDELIEHEAKNLLELVVSYGLPKIAYQIYNQLDSSCRLSLSEEFFSQFLTILNGTILISRAVEACLVEKEEFFQKFYKTVSMFLPSFIDELNMDAVTSPEILKRYRQVFEHFLDKTFDSLKIDTDMKFENYFDPEWLKIKKFKMERDFNNSTCHELKLTQYALVVVRKTEKKERFIIISCNDLVKGFKNINLILNESEPKNLSYIDKYQLLQSNLTHPTLQPSHYEWALNQAILCQYLDKTDRETKKILEQLTLQAFYKTSLYQDSDAQTNPLSKNFTNYHRIASSTDLYAEIQKAYQKELYLENSCCLLIDDPKSFKEALIRCYPQPRDLKNKLTINSIDAAYAFTEQLIEFIDKNGFPKSDIFLDFSALTAEGYSTVRERYQLSQALTYDIRLEVEKKWPDTYLLLQGFMFVPYKGETLFIKDQEVLFFNFSKIPQMTAGQTLNPEQMLRAWQAIKPFKEITPFMAELGTQGHSIPTVCKDWNSFCAQPILERFLALGEENLDVPYLQVLPKATVLSLKGLKDHNVDAMFHNRNLDSLLQIFYFRLINSMQEAILRKDDITSFTNQIESIHQIIQNILGIIQPYQPGELGQYIVERMKAAGTDGGPVIPPHLTAHAYYQNSGMRNFNSIMSSIEALKGDSRLNIVFLKDTYYEMNHLLLSSPHYQIHSLDGDLFREKGYDPQLDVLENTQSIDAFVCEFHHNFALERNHYQPEKVIEQIKMMIDKKILADPCTVIIDTTINLERSDELRQLLHDPQIKEQIEQGKLNVVFSRSAHKFDMLGLDNYCGGIAITIDNGKDFDIFNTRMNYHGDQVQGINRQGMTHLYKYNAETIEDYRLKTMENVRYFYSQLPSQMIYSEDNKNRVQFSRMNDEKAVFTFLAYANLNPNIPDSIKDNGIDFMHRQGFGFNRASWTNVAFVTRYHFGLEDKRKIKVCTDYLCKLQEAIDQEMNEADVKSSQHKNAVKAAET